jgi:S-adenosylmethionine hydrolase
VYLAIVDPGVGTERRPVVVRAGEALLVGPDNGVLSQAWEELGGVQGAYEIASPDVKLRNVSPTFHGRDVFAPCAAHLAGGVEVEAVGGSLDPGSLEVVTFPGARIEPGYVHCKVIGIDRFGNVQLSGRPDHLDEAGIPESDQIYIRAGGHGYLVARRRAFAEVSEGHGVVIIDSSGYLTLAKNRRHAAREYGVRVGDHVVLAGPPPGE